MAQALTTVALTTVALWHSTDHLLPVRLNTVHHHPLLPFLEKF